MPNQEYYNRYQTFINGGDSVTLPGIIIPETDSDKRIVYKKGKTRFDRLSQDYYGNPYHGFLIMSANQQFGSMEFDIPDGQIIRIPFPFESALSLYDKEVAKFKVLYGI
jgi:hypothetical protein